MTDPDVLGDRTLEVVTRRVLLSIAAGLPREDAAATLQAAAEFVDDLDDDDLEAIDGMTPADFATPRLRSRNR